MANTSLPEGDIDLTAIIPEPAHWPCFEDSQEVQSQLGSHRCKIGFLGIHSVYTYSRFSEVRPTNHPEGSFRGMFFHRDSVETLTETH